jgi:hypothetical protein
MVTSHVLRRIEERQIEIDIEMIEYFCQKYNDLDTAVFLGIVTFLGDKNYVILIIRGGDAVTIEFRRCSQICDEKSLKVQQVVEYPCLF